MDIKKELHFRVSNYYNFDGFYHYYKENSKCGQSLASEIIKFFDSRKIDCTIIDYKISICDNEKNTTYIVVVWIDVFGKLEQESFYCK